MNKPAGGEALVKSERSTIFSYAGDEAFFAAIDTYLVDTTWLHQLSWENNTDAAQTYTYQYTTELKVTKGTEVTVSVGIGAVFKGLSIGIEASTKTFSTYETTSSQTRTLTVNVPPRKKVTFYQRRYTFTNKMFFILDAWREEWNAGSPGGYDIARKECTVQIMSEDYLTTETELTNGAVGTIRVNTVGRANNEGARKTRKRENLTERAKRELSKMGV